MEVSKKITIDLNRPRKETVHLGQADNQHKIVLTLLKDGLPFDVSEGIGNATLVAGVQYIKANGVPGYYDWTSTDMAAVVLVTGTTNVWNVLIDEHATDVPGFAQIFVKFSLASGETLYSFPITLDVIRTSGGTTDPDRPYYHSTSFLLAGAQAEKTPAMSFPVGVDGDGKLWAEGGWSAEAKEALIACFEQVAWQTPYGQTYLSALETALYPDVHLVSITAAYDQDRPILDTNSLDLVKLDLVVTANYSDGTTETLADDAYELSGTLTAGTSTITVSYGGKTDAISVTVKHNYADSLSNWMLTATPDTAVYENGEISLHCRYSTDISNYYVYTADRAKTLWSAVEGKTLKIRLKVRGNDFGDYSDTNKLVWAVVIYKNASVTNVSGDNRQKWKTFTSFAPTNNAAWVEDTITATIANMTGGTGTPTSESTFGINVYSLSLKYAYIVDAEIYEV